MAHIRDHNPHTERFDYCEVVYWKDGAACGKRDGWTHADVQAYGQYPNIRLARDEQETLESVLALLAQAFNLGKRERSREFRILIGVPQ